MPLIMSSTIRDLDKNFDFIFAAVYTWGSEFGEWTENVFMLDKKVSYFIEIRPQGQPQISSTWNICNQNPKTFNL